MKKLLLSATAALSIFAACQKEDMSPYLLDSEAVRIEAAVGTMTKSNPLGSTEEQKKFNDGDRISITNAGKTVVYRLQSGAWTPENADEYLKWDKKDLSFTAKYPADYTGIPDYQDTKDKLAAADYMEGTVMLASIPDDRALRVDLFRKNALVRIKVLKYNDEYNEETDEIRDVRICGKKTEEGVYDNEVTEPLLQDKDGNVVTTGGGKVGYTYSAIVSPNAKDENSDGRFVNLSVYRDGVDLSGYQGISVIGFPELIAGKSYTFDLIVGKTSAKIGSITVNNWTNQTIDEVGETDPVDTWDGQTATAFATQDADGSELGKTEDKPILINNCAQLAYLAQQVNDGYSYENTYFRLTDDLNLADKRWTPIGKFEGCFSGHFDGNNHDILRLNVDGSPYYAGLFGRISGGSVKNVNIRSGSVRTDNDAHDSAAGGIAGHIYEGCRIENCTASVNVSGKSNVGGVVGYIINGSILNCHFLSGEIDGGESVGGIVGNVGYTQADKNTVRGCSTNASVKGAEKVGGLCGWFGNGYHKFSNCTMKGSVTVTGNSCGGLVGYLSSSIGTFESCQFEGSIKKDGSTVSNTGIAIGYDESAVTFSECVCTIDTQTYMALNGWEAGSKSDDYIGIEVTVK